MNRSFRFEFSNGSKVLHKIINIIKILISLYFKINIILINNKLAYMLIYDLL